MVGIAQKLVVIVAMIAGVLGALAAAMPSAIPTTVPALCVRHAPIQVGYCP